jgi:hypothetical protein
MIMGLQRQHYKDLGDISATPFWASIALYCDRCKVRWIGCWDNSACECGDHQAWDEATSKQYEPNPDTLAPPKF